MADLGTATLKPPPTPLEPIAAYLPVGVIGIPTAPTGPVVPTWGQLWPRGNYVQGG